MQKTGTATSEPRVHSAMFTGLRGGSIVPYSHSARAAAAPSFLQWRRRRVGSPKNSILTHSSIICSFLLDLVQHTGRTFDADMELMSWQAVFSPVCGSFLTERLACGVRGRRNSQLFNDAMFRRQATGRNNGRRGEQD